MTTDPQLTISIFGTPQVMLNGAPVSGWVSRKSQALLLYLATERRRHQREQIATVLFDSRTSARALGNLSVLLSDLRKKMGASFFLTDRHTIQLNPAQSVTLDAHTLTATVEQLDVMGDRLTRSQLAMLRQAVDGYQEVLAGFHVRNATGFEEWLLLQRAHYQEVAARAWTLLTKGYESRNQLSESIEAARQLQALDPLRESTHRQLMRLYLLQGERSMALAQFETLQTLLWDELGVEPDDATLQLHEQIARETGTVAVERRSQPQPTSHNLPAETTVFFGRTRELAQLHTQLDNPDCRLLTLVGQGGSGKSRLAMTAARSRAGRYLDGVWFVPLAAVTDTAGIVTTLANVFGLHFQGNVAPREQVQNWLRGREMLLVLDNFEQLMDGDAPDFISGLLQAAPDVQLLITSRERLQLAAEWLLEVGGLPYSADSTAARDLFVERATRLQPEFALSAETTPLLLRLCQLVDGLPLAIELAASWIRTLSLSAIVGEVERNLDFLATRLRDLPPRHRSIRAVIDASWQQLTAHEQIAYAKLAIFRASFSREAAQAVTDVSASTLALLIDRSLLDRVGQDRYRFHPLLQQFATERLTAKLDLHATLSQRHATYFAQHLAAVQPAVLRGDAAVIADLRADAENVRSAWQWAVTQQARDVIDIAWGGYYTFLFDVLSQYAEGIEQFTAATAFLDKPSDEPLLAALTARIGWLQMEMNQIEAAAQSLEASLTLAQKQRLLALEVYVLARLAMVKVWQGELARARELLESAETHCRAHPDLAAEHPVVLVHTAILYRHEGHAEQGLALLQEAHERALAGDDTQTLEVIYNNLGTTYFKLARWAEARTAFEANLERNEVQGNRRNAAIALHNLMHVCMKLRDFAAARDYGLRSLRLFQELQQTQYATMTLSILGDVERLAGQRSTARKRYRAALRQAALGRAEWIQLDALERYARLLIAEAQTLDAHEILTFVAHHPAAIAETRESAERQLAELVGVVSADSHTKPVPQRSLVEFIAQF